MKKIVIAPYETHQNLYAFYRKDNPFCDVKFYSKESLLKEVYYQYSDDTILYLINNHHFSYDLAVDYLKEIVRLNIQEIKNEKIQHLIDLQKELIKNDLLDKNEYLDYELSQAEIDIYFYSPIDQELLNVLNSKKYSFISQKKIEYPTYYQFLSSEDELTFLFNEIIRLIKSGVKPSDISVANLDDGDELLFKRLVANYHLNFNNAYPSKLIDKNYVQRFLNNLLNSSFDEAFAKAKEDAGEDDSFIDFDNIISKYKIEGYSNLEQANLYKRVLAKKKLKSQRYLEGINVTKSFIGKEGGYLFICNFVQGKFPTIIRNNSYLNDEEKASIGIVTNQNENAANLELFKQYLQQNCHIYLLGSNHSYSETFRPSPFIELLKLKKIEDSNTYNYYSDLEAKLKYANLKDLRRNYLDDNPLLKSFDNTGLKIPYRSFDYRFTGAKHFSKDLSLTVSYSQIKTYSECKYKYYLNNILKIDEFEGNFATGLGNLAHDIFEHIDEDKSFDELYELAYKKQDSFSKYDYVYLKRLKEELRETYQFIKDFESNINNPHFYREVKGTLNKHDVIALSDKVFLDGRIDKAITFGDDNKYLAIIDYKSGHEDFKVERIPYGLSLQLPTYALIAREGDRFKGKEVAGLFIQRIITASQIESRVDISKKAKPLLEGVFLDDINVISSLDDSISNGTSTYISRCNLKADGSFNSKGRAISKDTFNAFADVAKEVMLNSAQQILNNDFAINPKIIKGDNVSCEYCPFKDICYRNEKSYVFLKVEGEEDETN